MLRPGSRPPPKGRGFLRRNMRLGHGEKLLHDPVHGRFARGAPWNNLPSANNVSPRLF